MIGLVGAATPPDVGDATGPVLGTGFQTLVEAFTDLAPWLIPAGLVILVVQSAVGAMSKGEAPIIFDREHDGREYFSNGTRRVYADQLSRDRYYALKGSARYRSGAPVARPRGGGGRRRRR